MWKKRKMWKKGGAVETPLSNCFANVTMWMWKKKMKKKVGAVEAPLSSNFTNSPNFTNPSFCHLFDMNRNTEIIKRKLWQI